MVPLLSLIVSILSLGTGRTTVLQGIVRLVIFFAYLFTTVCLRDTACSRTDEHR
ncbi:hypothetical protein BH09PSE3_BH09PSE3_01590 [soil metagenome]